jgi:F-type H+-transporting ATPase subunit epsilon
MNADGAMSSGPLLTVELVTPEGRIARMPATFVEFPSGAGELGIFPGHLSLVVDVSAGEMRVHSEDGVRAFAIAGGFAQINPDSVRMVVSFAMDQSSAETEIETACERAREALRLADTLPDAAIETDVALLKSELVRLRETRRTGRSAQTPRQMQ